MTDNNNWSNHTEKLPYLQYSIGECGCSYPEKEAYLTLEGFHLSPRLFSK